MNTPAGANTSTEAVITVLPNAASAYGTPESNPTRIVNTVNFSYSSDILQLGDPFSVTIPNPRGQYTDKFLPGQTVQLHLRNPAVEGNALTLKHRGIITRRRMSTSPSGSALQLDCADLGWHLLNNDAPLWYRLQYAKFYQLLTDPTFIDPSWGIQGVAADNATNRLLRQRVNNGRAQAEIDLQSPLGVLAQIQVEPGDKIADLINKYARRINRLVNVSCDGWLQVWQPDYNREALFRIDLHGFDDPVRLQNIVLDSYVDEDISTIYTITTCIGEIVGGDLTPNVADQNFAKQRGDWPEPAALPFLHRTAFTDPDIYEGPEAKRQAEWRYQRGIFDSWQAVYVVRGHWQQLSGQRAYWWESDQMCAVHDTVNGVFGKLYVQSVVYDRDEKGDRTTVTLRKARLQAAFGIYPPPPVIKGSVVDTHKPTVGRQT